MSKRDENIRMLDETLDILEKGYYEKDGRRTALELSREQMEESIVLLPQDIREIEGDDSMEKIFFAGRCGVGAENADALELAMQRYEDCWYMFDGEENKNILVLNLANPVHPGGGVRNGAQAQEESLCRRSSLLAALESSDAQPYYEYNAGLRTRMGSDAVIITPNVEIIRDEQGELLDESVIVSVMTCAAPSLSRGIEGLSQEQYEAMVYGRIRGMLTAAAFYGYRVLVLGAFGCGAFHNDAHVVSDIFYQVMKEFEYNDMHLKDFFRRIDFAVLDHSRDQYNYREFARNFSNFYRDEDQAEYDDARSRVLAREAHLDQIRGCMLGGAVGDALGYPVEFLDSGSIDQKYGRSGIQSYDLDPATGKALISDDTQMTLYTAAGIMVGDTRLHMRGVGAHPHNYVAGAYLDWLATQEMTIQEWQRKVSRKEIWQRTWLNDVPELFSQRAPGTTCLTALEEFREGNGQSIDHPRNNSKGCGGIMRVAPLALYYDNVDEKSMAREGAEIAAITHGNSLGYIPAAVITLIINQIVFGKGGRKRTLKSMVIDARDKVRRYFKDDKHIGTVCDLIDQAISLSENEEGDRENIRRLGEGWVAEETMAIAIYCSLRHQDDFSAGVIAAVNHSGDSDSTGAVTGNILGALLGFSSIEEKWTRDLELKDVIQEVADDLCHRCIMNEYTVYWDPNWETKYMEMHRPGAERLPKAEEDESDEEFDAEAFINSSDFDKINELLRNGGLG